MTFSLNELEGLLSKAATGAGFPTGHAVAIATAGVWLARHGAPVCDLVARSIGSGMRASKVDCTAGGMTFRAARAAVDGVPVIDLLLAGAPGDSIELQELDEPVLLLGLAGVVADRREVGFEMNHLGGGSSVILGGESTAFDTGTIKPGTVSLALAAWGLNAGTSKLALSSLATRYDPTTSGDTGWDKLAALASKTYVPATEQSRISGAGAGLTDND